MLNLFFMTHLKIIMIALSRWACQHADVGIKLDAQLCHWTGSLERRRRTLRLVCSRLMWVALRMQTQLMTSTQPPLCLRNTATMWVHSPVNAKYPELNGSIITLFNYQIAGRLCECHFPVNNFSLGAKYRVIKATEMVVSVRETFTPRR